MLNRRRSKTLPSDELRELGFELRYSLHDGDAEMRMLADLTEILEMRGMTFMFEQSGQIFLFRYGGSASGADRRAVLQWLQARHPQIANFRLGELIDVWQPPRTKPPLERQPETALQLTPA